MLKKLKKKENLIFAVSVLFAVFAVSLFFTPADTNFKITPTVAEAAVAREMLGFAWSDNIGWISFNCADLGNCATVNYKVAIAGNGDMSGYAWSDNIGWISFNASDLVGCPVLDEGECPAKLTGNHLRGWAKALAGKDSATDGWDGWISLRTKTGDSYAYQVDLVDNGFEGYAWGSEVLGWVLFNTSFGGVTLESELKITYLNVSSVANGGTPTVTWTTENAESCEGSWTTGDVCSSVEECASASDIAPAVVSATTYILTCYAGANTVNESFSPPLYYNLFIPSGYSNEVDISFAGGGATTTPTRIGVAPYNGFQSAVLLSADLSSLPIGSKSVYSSQTLSPANYALGSQFEIYIPELITGQQIIPVSGDGPILSGVNVIINAAEVNVRWQEI